MKIKANLSSLISNHHIPHPSPKKSPSAPNTNQHTTQLPNNTYNLPQVLDKSHTSGPLTTYTPQLAASVLDAIRTTDQCVDGILARMHIGKTTWYDWVERYPQLADEYDALIRARARAEVERNEAQWEQIVDPLLTMTPHTVDVHALQLIDAQSRVLDRRCRYTQWRAQAHNPARYAQRALLGVQAITDPSVILASTYAAYAPADVDTGRNVDNDDTTSIRP